MNLVGFKKIVKLVFALLLAGLGLLAAIIELPQEQSEVQDELSTALAAYRKAVELDPNNAEAWNKLGYLLYKTGELKQAEEVTRKVLALGEAHQDKEEQAKALGNLGFIYHTRGELDQAEEMYQKALELNEALGRKEGIALAYANLGNLHYGRDNLEQAEVDWRKSLRLYQEIGAMQHPYAKKVQRRLDHLIQEYNTALAASRKAVELDPNNAETWHELGYLFYKTGELAQAEEAFRKVLALGEAHQNKQEQAEGVGGLGIIYWTRRDLDKAEELWKKSLRLYQEMGVMQHPGAKIVRQNLDNLAAARTTSTVP